MARKRSGVIVTPEEARTYLGLDGSYTEAELGRADRVFARTHHPDRHPAADAGQLEWHQTMFLRGGEARDTLESLLRNLPAKPEPAPTPHFEYQERWTPSQAAEPSGSYDFSATWQWTVPSPGPGQRQTPEPPKPKPKPISREEYERLLDRRGFTTPPS